MSKGKYLEDVDRHVRKTATSRIDKLLSSLGYGSRNEVARLARAGQVTLDGNVIRDVTLRVLVTSDLPNRMIVGGQPLDPLQGLVILLDKPVGFVCSRRDSGRLVDELLPERWRRRSPVLSTIGRLDKDTSGLLLLTDDGNLLHRVISPRRHVRKTYLVGLARPLNGFERDLFASGRLLLDGETRPLAPAELRVISPTEAKLTITEGRYHQVRRMFAAAGNHVETLHRESVGGLALPADLLPGKWQILSNEEIELVFR